jgi:hypothetical protein
MAHAQDGARSPQTPSPKAVSANVPASASANVPTRHVATDAAGLAHAPSGASPAEADWYRLIDTLPAEDRKSLQAINRRYFGALAFQDAGERRRLRDLGFPTLEQILEASRLSDQALEARAHDGGEQMEMLFVDRLLVRAEAARANGSTDPKAYEAAAMRAMVAAGRLVPRSRSPFAAYLDGRTNWKLRPEMPAEMMAASLMVAAGLGDWRATTSLRQFQRQNPGLDAASTVMLYDILRHTWRIP